MKKMIKVLYKNNKNKCRICCTKFESRFKTWVFIQEFIHDT